jgi:hypothetical protein
MRIPIQLSCIHCIVFFLFLFSGSGAAAQSAADQSFKAIPQQARDAAETKATTKTSTVSNNALNKLDSASNKAFKSFTGMFKKKGNSRNKKSRTDSTGIHPTDTVAIPPKTTS